MSYSLYNVEGIVLSSILVSESSSILFVLTEDLGLIRIWAQGVRKVSSKLAPHIQDLSKARIVVVKGREYWRLTDAEKSFSFESLLREKNVRSLVVRLVQIVKRLAHESAPSEVFILTNSLLHRLENIELSDKDVAVLEIMYMFRLLHVLGYGDGKHNEVLMRIEEWREKEMQYVSRNRLVLVKSVNDSMKESQL